MRGWSKGKGKVIDVRVKVMGKRQNLWGHDNDLCLYPKTISKPWKCLKRREWV